MPHIRHFRRPVERDVTRPERDNVTFLWGGLTARHEALITAAMQGLGYRVQLLPTPTKADFQTGREYGNNGMCNPAHFTVGALINFLKSLRDVEGLSTEEIIRNYAYYTAGSMGPCRFGMYESEYRLALRNSGFDGFRVLLFQQKGGMKQSGMESAVDLNAQFGTALLNGVIMGDILNELAYRIRPYEVDPGQTDRVFADITARLSDRLRAKSASVFKGRALARVIAYLLPGPDLETLEPIVDQVVDHYYVETLRECVTTLNREIEVDFLRVKPVVKVTGEFWAQTTEGDGNFRLFSFLESQGAEVLVEPLTSWANYLCDLALSRLAERRGPSLQAVPGGYWNLAGRTKAAVAHWRRWLIIRLGQAVLNREYERIRRTLGGAAHLQVSQAEMRRMARPFYDPRLTGGEGHLEVSKTIYCTLNRWAHMILSVKPFGCLPSTQSDGAQAAVLARFPEINFLSVETSGEGELNAYSRIQMALTEAKTASRNEFAASLEKTGYALDNIRAYCAEHREFRRPIQPFPQYEGVCGKAANFVRYVASRMDRAPARRARKRDCSTDTCTGLVSAGVRRARQSQKGTWSA